MGETENILWKILLNYMFEITARSRLVGFTAESHGIPYALEFRMLVVAWKLRDKPGIFLERKEFQFYRKLKHRELIFFILKEIPY